MQIESLIIRNLIVNEDYTRQVSPHLKREYFDGSHAVLFDVLIDYVRQYNKLPDKDSILVEIGESRLVTPGNAAEISSLIEVVFDGTQSATDWLLEKTEAWAQERALHLAIVESVSIITGQHESKDKGAIPSMLSDALAVSFDKSVGHDYYEDAEARWEYYTRTDERIPFGLEIFDKITEGGLSNKTLSVIMAGVHTGKSLVMCSMAADNLSSGRNVLYITLEMSEEETTKRIDANLLDIDINRLKNTTKEKFLTKVHNIQTKNNGRLVTKQFPTGAAHVGHFRALLNELALKKNFVPDIIYVDYINICASSRLNASNSSDSYNYVKSIAQEMRGFAIENNVPVVTATQVNRSGYGASDVDMTNVSESFGLPAIADFMIALLTSEQLKALNQIQVKQLKNRFGSMDHFNRFVMGVDVMKMRFYDLEEDAQDLADAGDTTLNTEKVGIEEPIRKELNFD